MLTDSEKYIIILSEGFLRLLWRNRRRLSSLCFVRSVDFIISMSGVGLFLSMSFPLTRRLILFVCELVWNTRNDFWPNFLQPPANNIRCSSWSLHFRLNFITDQILKPEQGTNPHRRHAEFTWDVKVNWKVRMPIGNVGNVAVNISVPFHYQFKGNAFAVACSKCPKIVTKSRRSG